MVPNLKQNLNGLPMTQVIEMRKKGLSDNQIIQTLQHAGFSAHDVLEAMEMADFNQKQGGNFNAMPPPGKPMPLNPASVTPSMPPPNGLPPMVNAQSPQTPNSMPPPNGLPPTIPQDSSPALKDDDIEELIEAIIDEKWAEVEKDIGRIVEWKDSVDERLGSMDAQIKDLKTNFDDLHKAILGKVGDYDKNILNVGSQLKAMEEVFSKVLPTFTDNVSELTRIADKLKKVPSNR